MPSLANCDAPKKIEKVRLSFGEDFLLSGTAAVTSKTIAAPIERIKMVRRSRAHHRLVYKKIARWLVSSCARFLVPGTASFPLRARRDTAAAERMVSAGWGRNGGLCSPVCEGRLGSLWHPRGTQNLHIFSPLHFPPPLLRSRSPPCSPPPHRSSSPRTSSSALVSLRSRSAASVSPPTSPAPPKHVGLQSPNSHNARTSCTRKCPLSSVCLFPPRPPTRSGPNGPTGAGLLAVRIWGSG